MTIADRRDSFCGKMSCCNNLRQYNIPYSLTTLHTVAPNHPTFPADLMSFAAMCRVTSSLRGLRIGAFGARPAAFNTVRYSEKILEQYGISVDTLDLYELFGWVNALDYRRPRCPSQTRGHPRLCNHRQRPDRRRSIRWPSSASPWTAG